YTRNKRRRSDVAEVVAFLKRFVEERDWAISVMERVLSGDSGFQDGHSGQDLFAPHIEHLQGRPAAALYERILAEVLHGSGGLEVWELEQADGELGLRLSTAEEAAPYFGVINIGDVSAFKRYLSKHLGLEVREDNFRPSQFSAVDHPNSPLYLLIGAKKFIEGWSSWRVSSMGLLNVGKGAGSQIIQLFGRGVRLKGKGMSLKRSAALANESPPAGLRFLETLSIFGWNANYVQAFRRIIENEDLGKTFTLRVRKMDPWPQGGLPVPQPRRDFDPDNLTWVLDADGPLVELDLTPRLQVLLSTTTAGQSTVVDAAGQAYSAQSVDFSQSPYADLLDLEALYLDLLAYKQLRGYANLHLSPQGVEQALVGRCRLRLPPVERTPERVQQAAAQALRTYLDRFVRQKEREAAARQVEPAYLEADDPRLLDEYRLRLRSGPLLAQIESLLQHTLPANDGGEPLPRLHFDRSLFNPLLCEGGKNWRQQISVHPPALNRDEQRFVRDVRKFWAQHHGDAAYKHCELYLLRNLALGGIGLFQRSGFYPDFILWLHNSQTGKTRVVFVEPHGLHHGGLAGNQDKFAALAALKGLSSQPEFRNNKIRLSGYLLTTTPVAQIPDAGGHTESQLEQDYSLCFQGQGYVGKILS
ncbi:MAG: hypothetical protein JXA37_08135, partial [Chloroflexia bacterium]|nr:hypothetical protein [Chloroflexia bacterium]